MQLILCSARHEPLRHASLPIKALRQASPTLPTMATALSHTLLCYNLPLITLNSTLCGCHARFATGLLIICGTLAPICWYEELAPCARGGTAVVWSATLAQQRRDIDLLGTLITLNSTLCGCHARFATGLLIICGTLAPICWYEELAPCARGGHDLSLTIHVFQIDALLNCPSFAKS